MDERLLLKLSFHPFLCQLVLVSLFLSAYFCQLISVSLSLSAYFCQLISDFCMYILNQFAWTSMADISMFLALYSSCHRDALLPYFSSHHSRSSRRMMNGDLQISKLTTISVQ